MKVLLINSNRRYFKNTLGLDMTIQRSSVPIGLLSVAAFLRERRPQIEIKIIDCLVDKETMIEERGTQIFHGLREDSLNERIEKFSPDIIGVTVNFTSQATPALNLVRAVKGRFPKTIMVIGGCHATVEADRIMEQYPEIDYIIRGEGETAFCKLVGALENGASVEGVDNLTYHRDGAINSSPIKLIENLDELPYPAYDLVDMKLYFHRRSSLLKKWLVVSPESGLVKIIKKIFFGDRFKDVRDLTIFTSRGCPFGCVFCSIRYQFGRGWRGHSAEYVIGHLKYLCERFKINYLHFEDDNVSFDLERFERILDGILENNLKFHWDLPNGIRADYLTEKIIKKMRACGCDQITVAVESGVQEILDKVIKKSIKLSDIERTLRICRDEGVQTGAFYMIGIPGETLATMQQTIDVAHRFEKKYGTTPYLAVAAPLPGTELYEICQANNYFAIPPVPDNYARLAKGDVFMTKTENFGPDDLKKMYRHFYHLDNLFIFSVIMMLKTVKRIIHHRRATI